MSSVALHLAAFLAGLSDPEINSALWVALQTPAAICSDEEHASSCWDLLGDEVDVESTTENPLWKAPLAESGRPFNGVVPCRSHATARAYLCRINDRLAQGWLGCAGNLLARAGSTTGSRRQPAAVRRRCHP